MGLRLRTLDLLAVRVFHPEDFLDALGEGGNRAGALRGAPP